MSWILLILAGSFLGIFNARFFIVFIGMIVAIALVANMVTT
jgi:hypothetical protein